MNWLAALVTVAALAGAQQLRLEDVSARVDRYLSAYANELANVVAEETYRQRALGAPGLPLIRILRSDYAITFVNGEGFGYRDTFEVDGQPVRGRDQRLQRMLESGGRQQAKQITELNARYNLANERFARSVNVPTMALELLQPKYRNRFNVRRIGSASLGDRLGWVLEFRERARPTIIRTPKGKNQPSRIEALVDPDSGEIRRTTISWENTTGSIVVEYGPAEGISVLVPITMLERFTITVGDEVNSDATYTNYRTFQTSGRLIEP